MLAFRSAFLCFTAAVLLAQEPTAPPAPIAAPTPPRADELDTVTESPIFEAAKRPTPPPRVPPTDALMPRGPSNNGGAGEPAAVNPVLQAEIDEFTPTVIPTSSIRTTTIMFPIPIDDVQGTGFTPDPSKVDGDFLISVRTRYISLTAQRDGIRRNLNVIAGGKNYPLDIIPASPPSDAAYSVILRLKAPTPSAAALAPFADTQRRFEQGEFDASGIPSRRSLSKPAGPLKSAGGARILGVLDQIKLLSGQGSFEDARKAAALMDGVTLVAKSDSTDHLDYKVTVTHVLRNSKLDALGFAVLVKNTSGRAIRFDPESFSVRVGDPTRGLLLRQVTSDIAPTLAPGVERRAFFVVIGTAEGAPNWVDPNNRFAVSLEYAPEGNPPTRPAAAIPPARPAVGAGQSKTPTAPTTAKR